MSKTSFAPTFDAFLSNRTLHLILMKQHSCIALACLAFCSFALQAQDSPYTVVVGSQAYEPLEEYSILPLGLGWDDPEVLLPLPFDMLVWNDTCTGIFTAEYGEVLDCMTPSGNPHHLAPMFGMDICDVSPTDSTGQDVSEIRHTLEGVAPNRIFKLEYHNVGFYEEVYEDLVDLDLLQKINVQVWLHEWGRITYHYGPNSITDLDALTAEGIATAGIFGDFDENTYEASILTATGSPDDPTFEMFTDLYAWFYGAEQGWVGGWPSAGVFYEFNHALPLEVSEAETSQIHAFPNPAAQVVQLTNPLSHVVQMTWLDASGRGLKEHSLAPGTQSVSVSDLPAGVYLLRANGVAMGRVQIQH